MRIKFVQKIIDKIRRKQQVGNSLLQEKLLKLKLQVCDINYKQNLVMDYFLNVSDAKRASGALRQVQQDSIILLSEIDKICKNNNIEYWLDFGSLLGAIRHKGFIPWDDDCDVSMINSDYRKFANIVNSDEYSDFECIEHIKNGVLYFRSKSNKNIEIDIFSYDDFEDRICKSFKPTELFPREGLFIPKNIVLPTKRINFEDIELNIPNDADSYLRFEFGNYTKIPHSAPIWNHTKLQKYINLIEYQQETLNIKPENTHGCKRERERVIPLFEIKKAA